MEDKRETFRYTYSAKEQEEVKQIREKYSAPAQKEPPLERLRRLDASATKAPTVVSLLVGIAGILLLGVGMSFTMVPGWEALFVPGIAIGLAGIAGVIAAYPIYTHMVKHRREQLAPEILRLTEELMQ